jgi:RNA polymerase sigma-70 factor (ECF subfamily)
VPASDVELVRGALDGAEAAFREIVQRYQRPIYGLIVRMVKDPGRAEELAQDAFVKAFRALHTYDVQRKFSSWLLTIAHHVAIDELRKGSLDTEPFERPTEDGERIREFADTKSATPAVLAERAQLAALLQTAIGRLRPEYREVVTLRYERDLDYDEIAEITGLPMGTVKSSLHRARKELAEHLENLGWNATTHATA